MFDYKLRFTDQAQADSALAQYEDDLHNVAIVKIGTMYEHTETDQTDEEGFPIFNSVALDGYHVDVRSRYEINFEGFIVTPQNIRHEIA